MRTLYFPIEISDREIDFRIMLASRLARRDRRVVIGHGGFMNQLLGRVRDGIYLGKSLFWPHQHQRLDDYQTAKQNGFSVLFLDEEGGVIPGREGDWIKSLNSRIDPRSLAADDAICAWGDFQGRHYAQLAGESPTGPKVEVTGHPKFDCYKPDWRAYFDADAEALRRRFGDFVLLNTNLTRANHSEGQGRIFSEASGYPENDPEARELFVRRWSYYRSMHAEFVSLMHYLGPRLSPTKLIVRPHPSEDASFYQLALRGLSNVETLREGPVSPWIVAATALIHDGCTTAVEAHIAEKKIIHYNPIATDDLLNDRFLPNSFGVEAKTREQVLDSLVSASDPPPGLPRTTSAGTRPEDVLLNLTGSSVERLEALLDAAQGDSHAGPPADELAQIRSAARSFAWVETAKKPIRLRSKKRRHIFGHARHKFPGFGRRDVEERLARANRLSGARTQLSLFSPYVFVVEG